MEQQDLLKRELLAILMLERSRPVAMDEFSKVMAEVLDETMLKVLKAKEPLQMRDARAILSGVKEQLTAVYGDLPDWIKMDEEFAAELMYQTSTSAMETQPAIIEAGLVAVTFDKLNKTQIDTLLNPNRQLGSTGFTVKNMVSDLNDYNVKRTRQILAKGVTAKQSHSEITRSLQNLWGDTTKHRADGVVRTAMIDSANAARQTGYEQFQSVIEGYLSVAIMDNRTSPICISLHLKEYKRSKGQSLSSLYDSIPDKPPRHSRCRTQLYPLTEDTKDILADTTRAGVVWDTEGIKGDKGRIKHRDGSTSQRLDRKDMIIKRLPADASYQEFFNTLTIQQQGTIVGGRTKAKLMREGKLSLARVLKEQRDGNVKFLTNDEIKAILND